MKFKIGDFVKIRYWDHANIRSLPIEAFKNWKGVCLEDMGRIEAINEQYIIISQTIENTIEGETEFSGCGILKNDIREIIILIPQEEQNTDKGK